MFKKAAIAAAAATVAFVAAPASAAVTVTTSMSPFVAGNNNGTPVWNATIGAFLSGNNLAPTGGAFSATYTFSTAGFVPQPNLGSASAVNVQLQPGSNIDFTGITLNGVAGTVTNVSVSSMAVVFDVPLTSGVQTLIINGRLNPPSGVGNASFGGNITLAAVPEPATWALFILGFGAVGAGMRRRSSQVRNTKAAIRFA